MVLVVRLFGPGIPPFQATLNRLLQCRHARALQRSNGSFRLPEDCLRKTELTQGLGAIVWRTQLRGRPGWTYGGAQRGLSSKRR